MANIIERFKAGFNLGIEAKVKHGLSMKAAKKALLKSTKKWEKVTTKKAAKAAKAARKVAR